MTASDTFFLIRRRGADDDAWEVGDQEQVDALAGSPHFEVRRCRFDEDGFDTAQAFNFGYFVGRGGILPTPVEPAVELTGGEQEFAARAVVISFDGGPLDGRLGFAPDTRPIQLGDGTYRFAEADPEDGAVYIWGATFYPAPWQQTPEPRPDDDSFELCGNCGAVEHVNRWQGFTTDHESGDRVPYTGSDEAPFWRCPACGFDHTDDDSDPATYAGTLDSMLGQRRDLIRREPGYVDHWREFAPGGGS